MKTFSKIHLDITTIATTEEHYILRSNKDMGYGFCTFCRSFLRANILKKYPGDEIKNPQFSPLALAGEFSFHVNFYTRQKQ